MWDNKVLSPVVMNCYILWDIAQCSPLEGTDVSKKYFASIFKVTQRNIVLIISLPRAGIAQSV
jgi:hypothetical protein